MDNPIVESDLPSGIPFLLRWHLYTKSIPWPPILMGSSLENLELPYFDHNQKLL